MCRLLPLHKLLYVEIKQLLLSRLRATFGAVAPSRGLYGARKRLRSHHDNPFPMQKQLLTAQWPLNDKTEQDSLDRQPPELNKPQVSEPLAVQELHLAVACLLGSSRAKASTWSNKARQQNYIMVCMIRLISVHSSLAHVMVGPPCDLD